MDKAIIAKVQSYGFDVYMRDTKDTWLLFTDGTRIGYLQSNRFDGIGLSTVHIPNTNTGTGFQVQRHGGDFNKADLEACFVHAPSWAASRDIQFVKKWRDIDAYINANSFSREYKLVPRVATETRYARAFVRKEGAQGVYVQKDFELTVTVQGSHHVLTEEIIAGIRAQGYETRNIVSHSVKRDCL